MQRTVILIELDIDLDTLTAEPEEGEETILAQVCGKLRAIIDDLNIDVTETAVAEGEVQDYVPYPGPISIEL
jgi:hypothetical protein